MKHSPTVSVVIPVYNGARYLGSAVESVLSQSWKDFELIIVDNASNDKTLDVAYGFDDPRITVYAEKSHVAIYENFNRSAAYAQGQYLKFLCADDELNPSCIEKFLELFDHNSTVGLVTSSRITIDETGIEKGLTAYSHKSREVNGAEALKSVAAAGNFIGEPTTTMFRRDKFQQLGGFPVKYRQLGDLHFWCQLLAEQNLYYHPLPQSKFRIHSSQTTNLNIANRMLWFNEWLMFFAEFEKWSQKAGFTAREQNRSLALICARLLRTFIYAVRANPRNFRPAFNSIQKSIELKMIGWGILVNFKLLAEKLKLQSVR